MFSPDMTLKVNTFTLLFPTFLKQDMITPAPRSHLQKEKRSDSNIRLYTFQQGLLVTGGYNSVTLSSTELYLPSTRQWTKGGDLPRHFINHYCFDNYGIIIIMQRLLMFTVMQSAVLLIVQSVNRPSSGQGPLRSCIKVA